MVAESVRDVGGRQFEELLAHGGAAGSGGRDPDLVQERAQMIGWNGWPVRFHAPAE
ncbi:hypothetical protein [Streptomyces cellostaticus]|uniref:hypothetical protein n=1 Tax=Streptomyces cellostaticus TaxID=67285 RepID=UPI000AFE28A5|nr:hypothetical protein [Streptomyces cellostaticus]GHI01797.1 hypothetical protein Scel_01180 [Streptomyces cellostaticus]